MERAAIAHETPAPTLLIVDDQPINVLAMHQAFSKDYRVLMANGGHGALRICRERLPDLILLDVVMPDLGGHEVCRQLKADPRTAGIPIIFVTAQDDPSQEMLGLQLGAVDFIAKPFNPAVMRARVRTHLELRRASLELAALNESLESRIVARTSELEVALRAADVASRAKSRFLSTISHEILTPINGVVGMAYLALKANPVPEQRGFLDKIHSSGQHLLELVEDILDFSKLVSGELVLEAIEFGIDDVLAGVASQTSATAAAKGLTLSFDSDAALAGLFLGDPLRIGQVLCNYIGNAIKFSSSGHVRVCATRVSAAGTLEHVRFDVRDEGIGLSQSEIAGLFQPFHQVDGSFTRRFGGNGLGLAVAKQMAVLMGGDVGVTSVEGEGSTFCFSVALQRVAVVLAEPVVMAATRVQPSRGDPLRGARILVAEDNLINLELAVALLEAVGVEVDVARDGRQAVDKAVCGHYDCILMDVQMPTMDGLEATRCLRADPRTRSMPILALTANAGREDRARCLDCGMDDVIPKPIAPANLYAVLARWLAHAEAGACEDGAHDERAAHSPGSPGEVVDLRILSRSVGGDPERFRRFARLFIDSVTGTLAELEGALANEDLQQLADLGHRLKTSSKMVGALGFADMCQRLEDMRHDDTVHQARQVVDQIPRILALVTAELSKGLL